MIKKQKYKTDLTDKQMEFIKELLPKGKGKGRPRLNIEEVINGILYVVVGGIAWHLLPNDFPKWKSVYHYFWKWRKNGEWERIYGVLRELERERQGRKKEASAGCLDSQSVKSVGGKQEARGYDAGKKITGRKRHLLVDTIGLPIAIEVSAASESDQAGAKKLLIKNKDKLKNIKKIWVDGTYRGEDWHQQVKQVYGIDLELVRNDEGVKGFVAQAKRWVVEESVRNFVFYIGKRILGEKSYYHKAFIFYSLVKRVSLMAYSQRLISTKFMTLPSRKNFRLVYSSSPLST